MEAGFSLNNRTPGAGTSEEMPNAARAGNTENTMGANEVSAESCRLLSSAMGRRVSVFNEG